MFVESVGLAAEEQREEQVNLLKRFQPSPVSAIHRRAMEQPPQPEIILVTDESGSTSHRVSSEDSDSEAQLPDPEESRVIISGNGFEIVEDEETILSDNQPFRDHLGRSEPILSDNRPIPDWKTRADQHMLGIEGKRPVPWEQFTEIIRTEGGPKYTAIEQKRHEERSVAPGPGNDVMVAEILAIWTDTLVVTLKMASSGDWPHAFSAWNITGMSKAIPFYSNVTIIAESSDVGRGFGRCISQANKGDEPEEDKSIPQWQTMRRMVRDKGIQLVVRSFDEEADGEFVKMRMVAILEAQEERERDFEDRRSRPSSLRNRRGRRCRLLFCNGKIIAKERMSPVSWSLQR
jgi:hypothetical protein